MSNATQKAGKQGGTFADRLKYLENATQSVLQLSKELKDSEAYQSDIRRLKDEIVNKDALITKKDAETTKKAIANGELIEQFRSNAVQWAEEKSTLQKSLEDEKAKQALANARKLDAATKEATAAQQRAHRDREELREVKAQLSGFKTQLEDTETELQTLQSSIGLVGSTERLDQEINVLASRLHSFASKYGGVVFSDSCDYDEVFVSLTRSKFLELIPKAIPISNSAASTSLRVAALESVIVKFVTGRLFQPLFPWTNFEAEEQGLMMTILDEFARVDLEKEAIFRALISSCTGIMTEREQSAITSVLTDITTVCLPLLKLNDREKVFNDDLQRLLLEMVEFWKSAQRSCRRVVAVNKAEKGVTAFEFHDRYGGVSEEDSLQSTMESPVAVCFPQIYQQLSTENLKVLHPGVALWSDQEAYTNGCQEFQAQLRGIKLSFGETSDRTNRRKSTGAHQVRRA